MAKKRSKKSSSASRKKESAQDEKLPLMDNEDQASVSDNDDAVEVWDIHHAYTSKQRASSSPKMCMADNCTNVAVAAWASSKDPGNSWEACEDCQEDEFGGWPEDFVLPQGFETGFETGNDEGNTSNEQTEPSCSLTAAVLLAANEVAADALVDKAIVTASNEEAICAEPEQEDSQETPPLSDNDDAVEIWDIQHVYTSKQRALSSSKICMADNCTNVAVAAWASSKDPGNNWEACEDCQENEFGGWPEDFVLPQGYDTCDDDDDDSESRPPVGVATDHCHHPSHGKKSKSANQITPPPNAINKLPGPAIVQNKPSSEGGSTFISPIPNNNNKKPSAAALAMHKKWQEAAESMNSGSKDVRIVLSKPNAKKLIYDCLHASFGPMNITDIYKKLMAVVPSPILSACLDDMVFAANEDFVDDGDDDEDIKKQKKTNSDSGTSVDDPFAATVLLKDGRNTSSNLYFLDQSRLENNGNGLLIGDRDELLTNMYQVVEEEADLRNKVNKLLSEAITLEMEPTNEHADQLLQIQMDNNEELEVLLDKFRQYPTNTKIHKDVKKSIEVGATYWRQRKRKCIDFLRQMEECTDGSILMKKSLAGDGPIELDSDETIVKSATEYAQKKKMLKSFHSSFKGKFPQTSGPAHDVNFVAVCLEISGAVRRIYLEE